MAEHFTEGTVKGTGVTAMTKATQLEPGSSHGNDESNASQNPQADKDQEGTGITAMTKATQLEPGSSHGNDESNASQNPQGDKDQEEYATYELFAICNHSGEYDSGHYVASIKTISSSKWYCFNDAFVHKEKDTSEESSGDGSNISSRSSSTAYMLMYRKEEVNSNQRVIADQGIPWNEQMGMRESSPFVNGATNHDLGQSNPTSDQNTEDLTQNIDTEMDEEKGIVETIGEMSSELMENGSLIHKTDGKEGENADEDEQCKGQTRIRKFSPIRNGGNNHDFGQSNPPSDQNTEDSSEDIDIVIKEENGAGGAMEKMRCGLLANESLLHNTDGKGGGNADADEKWNERKRMRKNSGTGNNVNNHGIRQGNPSSDPHTEHSPESSDAVMKGKQGTMKNIGMTCELKEKEKQIEETDWKED
ncbi:uncharacterized protein DDB_G0290685-like isoform X4 [Chiloscyllium plagiosum]|uniref:uncharacterized protein DDB_G0290685-like isoform X4 n=1 Tax=Chiloscyllium plagiosum TaxID=36176 RepID=UPI001CB7F6F0|nr:uncharacterized protein DDB_G0290685-like isoform X4 [Chiloscyllium plagiosum]